MDRACLCLAQSRDAGKELKNLSITTAAVALAAALDTGRGWGGGSGGVAVMVDEDDWSGGGSRDDWFPLTSVISLLHDVTYVHRAYSLPTRPPFSDVNQDLRCLP